MFYCGTNSLVDSFDSNAGQLLRIAYPQLVALEPGTVLTAKSRLTVSIDSANQIRGGFYRRLHF